MKRMLAMLLPLCLTTTFYAYGIYEEVENQGNYWETDSFYQNSSCGDSQGCSQGCDGFYNSFADVSWGRYSANFEVGFAPMWLKPYGSNHCYAAEAYPLPLPSPNWQIFDVRPDYSFGFDASLGIYFCESDAWISLDYQHFKSKQTAHARISEENNMMGPFYEIGPDAFFFVKARGEVKYLFDEVNLDYGVSLDLSSRLRTNLFGGITFARIHQNLIAYLSNDEGDISRRTETPSTFTGVGPQIGIDFAYRVWNGLDLTGKSVGEVLVGRSTNYTEYKSLSPALAEVDVVPPNTQNIHVQNRSQAVPAFAQRLGIAYTYTFCRGIDLNVELGYEAKVFFNAIQSVDMGSEVNTPPLVPDTIGVYARTFHRTVSNFVLAGPYLNFNVGF